MHGFKSFIRKTEIPFNQGINVVLGPNGSGKCLTGDSIVTLGDGTSERIDNIINSRLNKAVKTEDGFLIPGDGLEVISLNLKTLKTERTKVKSFVKRTSPEKILSIKTRSGRAVKTTKYHPLFILKNNQIVEARADELKQGVRIAVPRALNFETKDKTFTELLSLISENDGIYVPYKEEYSLILRSIKDNLIWKQLAEKIGISYYVIKGLLDKQSINFCYLIRILRYANLSDLEITNLINELISNGKKTSFNFTNSPEFSRFFGYLLAEGRLAESSQIWFTNGDKNIVDDYITLVEKLFNKKPLVREYKPNCWDVIIYSEPLKKILSKLGMASNTSGKKISNILLKHSSGKEVSELLNGLYCGDGYVSKSSIEITTKSAPLAQGIETCLLRLGILFSTRDQIKGIKSSGFTGKYKTIIITGVDNFRIFDDSIQLIHQVKRQRIKDYLKKKSNPNTDLIGINNLVKDITKELKINVKHTKMQFPLLEAYCYNQCFPSRNGLQLLSKQLFKGNSELIKKLNFLAYSDIFWDEITDISEINGEGWVYDLCVDEHHNFLANNIFVHNSNITDALCFVLGRLSIKSMRAAKAKNLIFLGTKALSPAKEASVEIVFDNSDKIFSIDNNEISIKRIVRKNGQSIYRINNETKTRQEVLTLLAQAGIDPNGFNIILQGEIQNFVRMHTEERRKIIEEVSGISIYEVRKQKSLKELERTGDKLKEVSSILRERTAYLNNLERERQEALRFKKLEKDAKRYRASIIHSDLTNRKREREKMDKRILEKDNEINKIKKIITNTRVTIESFESKISSINQNIQKSTGIEQEKLNQEIANLRAELAGLNVRLDNSERKLSEVENQRIDLAQKIRDLESEIKELQSSKSSASKKQKDIEEKKQELDNLEKQRKEFYMTKSELKSIKERMEDKNSLLQSYKTESDYLIKQIEVLTRELFDKNTDSGKLDSLKVSLSNNKQKIENLEKREKELEKISYTNSYEIDKQNKIRENISKMDICPLCKSKITKDHISSIHKEVNPRINHLKKQIEESEKEFKQIGNSKAILNKKIDEIDSEISSRKSDQIKIFGINDKKEQIKMLHEKIEDSKKEMIELEKRRKSLESKSDRNSNLEQKYETARIEIQEISMRSKETLDSETSFKKRELDRSKAALKQLTSDEEDIKEDVSDLKESIEEKESFLEDKKGKEEALTRKFQKLISEREGLQKKIRDFESFILTRQNSIHNFEQDTNLLKIEKAKIDAAIENLETDMLGYPNVEIIKATKESLIHKLERTQEILSKIGTVNLRSLEVYDSIKKEYDLIKEKVEIINKEKEGIMKIIHEIDIKKKKTFFKTLDSLNETFSRNFSQLSTKGRVSLELENRKDPFEGGVNIIVKTGHGKYFDVTSLSGGEQTIVALSLIFAIQEYSPYCFYILDEIDAALDKRNSERLAGLLRKYMQKGQYIVITHNDEVITNASNLYGVSMHDGVSKIITLKV
ncbi:chromosome partition protein Smc [archaeon BMS3Abin17]|nr:chromosome partition protein Smc [archaeon BMS3Abin17]